MTAGDESGAGQEVTDNAGRAGLVSRSETGRGVCFSGKLSGTVEEESKLGREVTTDCARADVLLSENETGGGTCFVLRVSGKVEEGS